ncbi:MAG: aldo/keto reductase [Flavobacterium sp.]|nr:MAG: aldo/keto reductase [Flavobacterium sp.]
MSLSRLIAGTMNWGSWGASLSATDMAGLMAICVENGIDTFDHADIYGGHTTESEFGNAFSQSGIERTQIKIITKCGIQYPSENRVLPIKHYDYSKRHIIWSVENSLQNLQTEYVDVLLLHRPSPLMQPDEIAEAIEKLRSEGKILEFGVSNFTPSQTQLIASLVPVSYNQIQFSATNCEAMTDGSLDFMQLNNIAPMAWNPLGNVFREETPQTQRLRYLLANLQQKYAVGADVILIAWILRHPAGIHAVCGTTKPERIALLRKATELQLEDTDWFALWVESRGSKVP